MQGIPIFLIFAPKHVPAIYVLSKNKKKYQNFSAENFQLSKLKNLKSLFIAWASFRNVLGINQRGTKMSCSRTHFFVVGLEHVDDLEYRSLLLSSWALSGYLKGNSCSLIF